MNNRGEIRWAPFQSILNVNDTMEELERKRNKTSKPILSTDELEQLERKILNAFHTRSFIEVTYYYQGIIYKKKGVISHISQNDFKVYFIDHTSLYFEQLLNVIFI